MSTLARRLCDQIVEPTLPSSTNNTKRDFHQSLRTQSSSREHSLKKQSSDSTKRVARHSNGSNSNSKSNGRTRSLLIEKKKVINKLLPRDSDASRCVINQYTSKEILLRKKFRDTAVNTNISRAHPTHTTGCMTLIQRREKDSWKICNCNQKNCRPNSTKEIQTRNMHFDRFDKACSHSIKISECGTETVVPEVVEVFTAVNLDPKVANAPSIKSRQQFHCPRQSSRIITPKLDFMGARRWAISKYPTRGPDF